VGLLQTPDECLAVHEAASANPTITSERTLLRKTIDKLRVTADAQIKIVRRKHAQALEARRAAGRSKKHRQREKNKLREATRKEQVGLKRKREQVNQCGE
jgi:hypothetical protein